MRNIMFFFFEKTTIQMPSPTDFKNCSNFTFKCVNRFVVVLIESWFHWLDAVFFRSIWIMENTRCDCHFAKSNHFECNTIYILHSLSDDTSFKHSMTRHDITISRRIFCLKYLFLGRREQQKKYENESENCIFGCVVCALWRNWYFSTRKAFMESCDAFYIIQCDVEWRLHYHA